MTVPDFPRCGAKNRSGQPCGQKAGWGTDHVGKGRCKLHGGLTPVKHGRYSTVSDKRLGRLLEEIKAQERNPLDVTEELTLMRALVKDWLERYTQLRDALLAWHANQSADGFAPPNRIPDVQEVRPLLETISRMVQRIEKAQSDKYIPRGQFYRIMMAMGSVVDARVLDDELKRQIREDWLKIELA